MPDEDEIKKSRLTDDMDGVSLDDDGLLEVFGDESYAEDEEDDMPLDDEF